MLIFETVINAFQAFVYCDFLVKCLEKKAKYSELQVYSGFAFTVFVYLQLQTFVTDFEGYGIVFLIVFGTFLSCIFCNAGIICNLIYNILAGVLAMFSSIIGASMVGVISHNTFLELTASQSWERILATVLIQIIWVGTLYIISIIQRENKKYTGNKFTYMALTIPILSIVICTVIMTQMQGSNPIWNIVVVMGIFVLNIIDFVLLYLMNENYFKLARDEVVIKSYEQQQLEMEQIRKENIIVEKNRHEIKRILNFIMQLLEENKSDRVMDYLRKMDVVDVIKTEKKMFTENVVLNYILNKTSENCKSRAIDFICMVNGTVDGIAETDLHILMENLIDNALEAIEKTTDKSLYIAITGSENGMSIEIVNSVNGNVLLTNPDFEKTTKSDKIHHGYGMRNIRDIVSKYKGKLEYRYMEENFIKCEIILVKC